MDLSNLNFYGLSTHEWIGVILPLESQKEQSSGSVGWGWRYKVAIMGYHPNDQTLKDDEVTYALVALGVSDGSGAAGRQRTPRLIQGDVVLGKFLDGDRRQNPIILHLLGRTAGVKYGKGRFEPKTGFVGSTKPGILLRRQETEEAVGVDSPKAISPSKGGRQPALDQLLRGGGPTIPTVGAFPPPPTMDEINNAIGTATDTINETLSNLPF